MCDVLMSGKCSAHIADKTVSIYYGSDFVNVQCVNFVSVAEDAAQVAKVVIANLELSVKEEV